MYLVAIEIEQVSRVDDSYFGGSLGRGSWWLGAVETRSRVHMSLSLAHAN